MLTKQFDDESEAELSVPHAGRGIPIKNFSKTVLYGVVKQIIFPVPPTPPPPPEEEEEEEKNHL